MDKIICNIPHSNKHVPEWALKDILISNERLETLIDFMTDIDVDKLWDLVPMESKQLATVSRLIVDTERFRNDNDEEMSQKGMGLYYTHTPFGEQFRIKSIDAYKKCLSIYDDYHMSLENKVKHRLSTHGKCIILDCHSFHDDMEYTDYAPTTFPDVCIGTNGNLTSEAKQIIDIFKCNGYSVKINEPFSGSLVPLNYMNDNRVVSIMIELNRRIYNNSSFAKIQMICKQIYEVLNTY